MRDQPLYCISTVAELMDVHPETLRVWERHGLVMPARRGSWRCYSDADLQRLLFIRHLIDGWGLNLAGVQAYLRLYPCWQNDQCPSLMYTETRLPHAKPCWRRPQGYCTSTLLGAEPCGSCTRRVNGIRDSTEGSCRCIADPPLDADGRDIARSPIAASPVIHRSFDHGPVTAPSS